MDNNFSDNLQRFRKNNKMTQEQLAKKLGISYQAVSKWENNQAYPDIALLPSIAAIFETSIDILLGYKTQKIETTQYEKRYHTDEYYWGNQVWSGCYEVLKKIPPIKPLRLLDIGCGEGQAAVFFAKNGYTVSAFDIAPMGIDKGKRLAELNHVDVNFFNADILDYRLENNFDIIYGSGVLQYINTDMKQDFFENIKAHTSIGGIHIFNVFVEKPFIPTPPDWEKTERFWKSGELFEFYYDWKIEFIEEVIFDCNSSGISHKHCMDVVIAKKLF